MRETMCVGAVMNFLFTQPGEFTPQEIRRLGIGFHCDNDEDDVELACDRLASQGFVKKVEEGSYVAYKGNPIPCYRKEQRAPARRLTAKEFTQAVRDYCRRHNCGADLVRTCTSVRREAIEEYEQKHNIVVTGLWSIPYTTATR